MSAKVKVKLNLMKWEVCKSIGETPEQFEKRMQYFVRGCEKIIDDYSKRIETETSKSELAWLEDGIRYRQRKINRIRKEIKKAYEEEH